MLKFEKSLVAIDKTKINEWNINEEAFFIYECFVNFEFRSLES
jgi:hypothetical protein